MAQLKDLIVAGDAQILGDLNANNFSGTDGTTAGKAGLVPAPATSDNNKYLKSDGTWAAVSSGSSDYSSLTNKPSINSITLSGNKTSNDLNLQTKLATPLTADLYLVNGTPTSLTEGCYYTGNYKIYVNNTAVPDTDNCIFTLKKFNAGESTEEDYFNSQFIGGIPQDSTPKNNIFISYFDWDGEGNYAWTSGAENDLTESRIKTTMPTNPNDRYVPSIKLLKTELATKGTYSKPSGGIPKTDLASAVQTSLGLADSALQSHLTAGTGISISSNAISVNYGTTSTTACAGDDSRLSNSRTPTSHAVNANTYGLGTTGVYGHCKTINGLTQSSHADGLALSAYQGYVLNNGKQAKITYSTTDLTAGTSDLATGELYVVYE